MALVFHDNSQASTNSTISVNWVLPYSILCMLIELVVSVSSKSFFQSNYEVLLDQISVLHQREYVTPQVMNLIDVNPSL